MNQETGSLQSFLLFTYLISSYRSIYSRLCSQTDSTDMQPTHRVQQSQLTWQGCQDIYSRPNQSLHVFMLISICIYISAASLFQLWYK